MREEEVSAEASAEALAKKRHCVIATPIQLPWEQIADFYIEAHEKGHDFYITIEDGDLDTMLIFAHQDGTPIIFLQKIFSQEKTLVTSREQLVSLIKVAYIYTIFPVMLYLWKECFQEASKAYLDTLVDLIVIHLGQRSIRNYASLFATILAHYGLLQEMYTQIPAWLVGTTRITPFMSKICRVVLVELLNSIDFNKVIRPCIDDVSSHGNSY